MLLSGVTLRALAVRTLGRNFRTEIVGVDNALVRSGVYRFLRHPSETGLLAASLGARFFCKACLASSSGAVHSSR